MLVKDVMTKSPITITPETSVPEAKALMTKQKINKLPVVDKSGALVGIITKNDLLKAAPSDATTLDMFELSYLLNKLTVEKVMHKDVKTVVETETVEEAARLMADYGIGCLPVMKQDLNCRENYYRNDLFTCSLIVWHAFMHGVACNHLCLE